MYGVNTTGTRINDFLGLFNIKGAGIGITVDALLGNHVGVLANLQDKFLETAWGRGSGPWERQMASFMPQFGCMPPMAAMPQMMPLCGCGYAGGMQTIDLAAGHSNIPFFSALFDPQRRMAGMFEQQLRNNPYARAAFEAQVGGRIVDFGVRNDGVFTIQRFAPGFTPVPGMMLNPLANNALGYMAGMQWAMGGQTAGLGNMYSNPFAAYSTGAFAGLMPGFGYGNPATMGGSAYSINAQSPNYGWGFGALQTPLGGVGAGSWNPLAQPGRINGTNPVVERSHQAEIDSVLRDPSLSVEDKVTLMIMLIMKKMDSDIERQAQYINSIQQQQSDRGQPGNAGGAGQGGKGGLLGGQGGGFDNQSSPSIDVETMKLKRMIDKRSQMFDMLRQIIDKYNQTAKGIIDSIGR